MLNLVIGGAASGKSTYAEGLVCNGGASHRIYIATMQPFDAECKSRIMKHRAARSHLGFETVECYTGLCDTQIPSGADILLECMSNLAANELFSGNASDTEVFSSILSGVERLERFANSLTIVSNDLFADGLHYDADTLRYLKLLARINRALAVRAQRVIEVVCGIPILHKGESICIG